MLDHLDEGLWAVTSPLKVLGLIPMASRMTVVRLKNGCLFVHSPVRLEPKLKAALDALGAIRHGRWQGFLRNPHPVRAGGAAGLGGLNWSGSSKGSGAGGLLRSSS
jgi:hypothetical protein